MGAAVMPEWPEIRGFSPPRRPPTYEIAAESRVYLIQSGSLLKIGTATDPKRRLAALRIGNPHGIRLVGYRSVPRLLAEQIERRLHKMFAAHRRIGEWFEIDKRTVIPELNRLMLDARMAVNAWAAAGYFEMLGQPLPRLVNDRIVEMARRRATAPAPQAVPGVG